MKLGDSELDIFLIVLDAEWSEVYISESVLKRGETDIDSKQQCEKESMSLEGKILLSLWRSTDLFCMASMENSEIIDISVQKYS